jgi:drug/metabolite transporter (DMT)-like permease
MILGFGGALLILSPWQADAAPLPGVLACLAAAASYGLSYVYMGRHLTGRGLPPLVLSASQLTAASGLLLLAVPFGGLQEPTWRPDAVTALLALGFIGTGVAYVINYRIISDDGPVLASTVTYLLPAVAVILGALVLAEPISAQPGAGVAIVLTGVALTRRTREAPAASRSAASAPTATASTDESGSN